MPGWVKWPGIIIGVLVLAFVVLQLFGVQHGPGMHTPTNPVSSQTPGGSHP